MINKEIDCILDRFEASDFSELSVKCPDFEITVKRSTASGSAAAEAPKEIKPISKKKIEDNLKAVQAPLAGTFYRAPSPEAEPFVLVGDRVEAGQVIGLIEAMKMINEVKTPFGGIVRKIEAENGKLVSFEQPLIYLEMADV